MADTKPPCLTVLGGPMAGNRFVLQDGVANILIGSDPACAFHLPLPGVGAMHARLSVEPGAVSIWEAGSPRGLHVNDSRVEGSAPLRNGDIVWLGTPGDADVVMLQVILPRLPSLVLNPSPEDAAEEAAAEAAVLEAAAAEAAAVEGETVALDPRSLSLEAGGPEPASEVEPVPDHGEPIAIPFDSPLDAHFANVAPTGEPEEAGVVVAGDAHSAVDMSSETLIAGPDVMGGHDFVLADEGLPLTVQEPASSITPPLVPPPAPKAPIAMPPGFEDETEDKLVEAEPEAQTLIVRPESEIEQTAHLDESEFTLPPVPPPASVAPARVTPARVTPPAPTPGPAGPAPAVPAAKPATPPVRPARPATTPPSRKPGGPSVSQRTEPAERPAAAAKAKSSSSTGLYVGLGLGALVVLGGGAYAVLNMMGGKAPAVAKATPPPVAPTTAPTAAAVATPLPVVEQTPEPAVAETPAPVVPTPTPVATPTGRPTPSPSPTTKPVATPTPSAVATPSGPSPEQLRAQQVAGLLTQADAAMGARRFDQAIAHYDEVLKLDPGNGKASSERARAVAARAEARKRFVPGRTVVATEKASGGGLSGFEGAAVQKAPDFLGRIEFEMSPASGMKAGDPWTLKIFVVNEGKKAIRITDLTATTIVNGEPSGGAGAKAREIAPQARAQVGEMAGTWKEGTQTWQADVVLTAKGDSLKNTLTWK
jgi:FHA domain